MNGRTIITILILSIILEIYTFFALRFLVPGGKWQKVFYFVYFLQSLGIAYAYYKMYEGMTSGAIVRNATANLAVGIVITSLVSKLVLGVLLLLQDGPRLIIGAGRWITSLFSDEDVISYIPSRRKALTLGATIIAAIPFSTMLYGITRGKYNFKVNRLKLSFPELPVAFEGFKIVQISDIHAGSFDNVEEVRRGIQMVNAEKGDIILFTGDMINSDKEEVEPFKAVFRELKSELGTYAVLGNHDYYGLYGMQEAEKGAYWQDFMSKFDEMGFRLINNDSMRISRGADSIQLVGVENWGAGRWFPKKGDLDKALEKVEKDDFCVLMSHDPTHWDHHVIPHDKKVHLTLSGHTHGMQFGINIPGFKWSPAKYRYPKWMGLYEENDQYLYVNRGFGVLGFPGRVGMWPEITVLELSRSTT